MATIAEQPCYTLIHTYDDSSEVPNEQQLKHDLGELVFITFVYPFRARGCQIDTIYT